MPLLLNLDTATGTASVCVSSDGVPLAFLENDHQKEHASFIHLAVSEVLEKSGVRLSDVDAVSITSGPGSYTGLRVGMATAKGFCYALSKPLITVNTLLVMAKAAADATTESTAGYLLCPMIDARRMEVFTALFNADLNEVLPPMSFVPKNPVLFTFVENNKIIFFGSGSDKFKLIIPHSNAVFTDIKHSAKDLGGLADAQFRQKRFTDIVYSQPDYLKAFHSVPPKV